MIKDNQNYNDNVEPNTAFLNELKRKMPEFFSENGKFDLNRLKKQLNENDVEELKDGYQLNFIGKNYARRQSGEKSTTVIVPDSEQNKGEGKDSKNLFFSGDNLEVLRHMQGAYNNKINVIYIDPPYNTGNNDFVYPDKFEYSSENMKTMFDLDDDEIRRLDSIKGSSSHSAWLTFMYPRLVLAKRVLNDNGIIFVSIDDNEYANLKQIMDEIFGPNNFITDFIWEKTQHFGRQKINSYNNADHILAYSKNIFKNNTMKELLVEYEKEEFDDAPLFNKSNNEKKLVFPAGSVKFNISDGIYKNSKADKYVLEEPVEVKDSINNNDLVLRFQSRWSNENIKKELSKGTTFWVKTENFAIRAIYGDGKKSTESPRQIIFTNESNERYTRSRFNEKVGTSENASKYLNKLLGADLFSYPKPVSLIKYLISLYYSDNKFDTDITVLDFFAGSSTTAEAVLQLNAEDGGNRKFIMVQLPEKTYTVTNGIEHPTKGGREAYKHGYKSIDSISIDRIKKASSKLKRDSDIFRNENFDYSFKHYNFVEPNQNTLNYIDDFDPNNISLFNDVVGSLSSENLNISGNASGVETVLNTWLMSDGYELTSQIDKIDIDGYNAYLIENEKLYLISDGWNTSQTKTLLNELGKYNLNVNTIVLFGYSFNIAEIKELEIGLRQLDMNVNLLKRY